MGNVIYDLLWKFFEKTAGQIVTFIVSVILARLLAPEEYGLIAMVSVFVEIANVLVSTGLSTSLIQKKNADELDFNSNFYLNMALSLFLYLLLYIFAPIIAIFYDNIQLVNILRILGLRILFSAYCSIQQAYISKHMLFKKTAIVTIIITMISAIMGIFMAYWGFGVWALVTQQLSMTVLQVIFLSFWIKWHPHFIFSWKRTREMLSYSSDVLIANILDTFSIQVRNLIIGKYYKSTDLAYYNRGDTYPRMLLSSVNNTLHVVLFAAYANIQENNELLKRMLRNTLKHGVFIIFPIMMGLGLVAKPLIILMLTPKWLECVPYLQISCFTYATWIIQIVMQEAIIALGHSKEYLKISTLRTILGLILILFVIKTSVLAIAISAAITNLFSVFLVSKYIKKYLSYDNKELFKDILPTCINTLFMAIIVYGVSFIPVHILFFKLCIQIVTGICVYILGAMIFKLESFTWLLNKLHQI